jgi:thiol-disulfide isomerase/thioredoxin
MSVLAYHFWSPTCQPCKVIKPAIEDLKEEFPDVMWKSVNIQDDPDEYAITLGVSVVPTIVIIATDDRGEIVYREKHSGTNMASYYRIIRSAIKTITH